MTALVANARTRALPLGLALLLPVVSLEVARLLYYRGLPYAAVIAVLPVVILLQTAPSKLYGIVVLALAATVTFGRDFSYVSVPAPHLGAMYILDLVLILVLVAGLPGIAQAVRTNQPQVLLVGGIVLWTVGELFRNPVTTEALRESVIGFYSLWAIVGMMLVAGAQSRSVARAVYLGGLAGTVVFAIWLASKSNPFSSTFSSKLVASSFALYLGWGILLVLISPGMIESPRRRQFAYGAALVQGAVIAASQSRSLWIAMVVALTGTALAGGLPGEARHRLLRYGAAFAALVVIAAIALPSTTTKLASVAGTIVSYNRAQQANDVAELKAADAQWRLKRWRQALEQDVYPHPLTGIGFGGEIIDDPVTRAAYVSVGEVPPRIDPHNSFIAFAGRLGLPGLALLLLFEAAVFTSATRVLRNHQVAARERALVAWLLACQLLTAGHSFFTVILEGPYMGIFFWLFGGMVIALDHRLRHAYDPVSEGES